MDAANQNLLISILEKQMATTVALIERIERLELENDQLQRDMNTVLVRLGIPK